MDAVTKSLTDGVRAYLHVARTNLATMDGKPPPRVDGSVVTLDRWRLFYLTEALQAFGQATALYHRLGPVDRAPFEDSYDAVFARINGTVLRLTCPPKGDQEEEPPTLRRS